jgi:2,3-bisphosphoglycerate-independent phosphoglycerate mutase
MTKRLVVLAILDGWGLAKPGPGNAISLAAIPNLHAWQKSYPTTHLEASGLAVGLPAGIVGNSEVGHLNLGAGYAVTQDEVRINQAIKDGSFFTNPALLGACQRARQQQRSIHILLLAGPGQVHSNLEHLWAVLQLIKQQHIESVYVHLFSDGRDASPTWMAKNAVALQQKIQQLGGQVASLIGRYYAMDRDQRWDRIEKAYRLLTERKGGRAVDLLSAVTNSYAKDQTDEFIEPTVIGNGHSLEAGDEVLFLNFRTDRPRQLSQALVSPDFNEFSRSLDPADLHLTTMTEYEPSIPVAGVVFGPNKVELPLARVLSDAGLRQLHAAETEKYAHVTYFFNGGQEQPFANEERLLVPSPKVATYDLQPAMSAESLTDQVSQKIQQKACDVVIMNYANADMVGHTGDLEATITAVETVDHCLGKLWQTVAEQDGVLLITADHGNAEVVAHPDGSVDTEHNSSPVPFIAIGDRLPGTLEPGNLSNVAATLLQLLDIRPPVAMTSPSLWRKP